MTRGSRWRAQSPLDPMLYVRRAVAGWIDLAQRIANLIRRLNTAVGLSRSS